MVVYACGDAHSAYVPGPAGVSSLHSNVTPDSGDVNVNDGAVEFVDGGGPFVIVVSGPTVSTVNDRAAGEASRLPATSRARTVNV